MQTANLPAWTARAPYQLCRTFRARHWYSTEVLRAYRYRTPRRLPVRALHLSRSLLKDAHSDSTPLPPAGSEKGSTPSALASETGEVVRQESVVEGELKEEIAAIEERPVSDETTILGSGKGAPPSASAPETKEVVQEEFIVEDEFEIGVEDEGVAVREEPPDDETVVLDARRLYGDMLPRGLLNEEQLKIYTRLYDTPDFVDPEELEELRQAANERDPEAPGQGTGVLREGEDGSLEEIEFAAEQIAEQEEQDMDDEEGVDLEQLVSTPAFQRLKRSKKGRFFALGTKAELDRKVLYVDMTKSDEVQLRHLDEVWEDMEADTTGLYLDDVRYYKLEQFLRDNDRDEEADELVQCLYIHLQARLEEQEMLEAEKAAAMRKVEADDGLESAADNVEPEEVVHQGRRIHPLTEENRFSTFPGTLSLPHNTLAGPTTVILSGTHASHLKETAHRVFGGPGMPYSTSNPSFAKQIPQRPIPLDPSLGRMTEIEADAYFAAVVPGTYASVMSALVETRKRLGSGWLQRLLTVEGGPRILDAGSAGAGVVAFREMLRAEWERIRDDDGDHLDAAGESAKTAGELEGGAPRKVPMGRATVLTGNAALRKRASALLENTTFVPHLPDYVHASDASAAQQGKFDVIVAPHALWPLKEDYSRRQYVANLWALLKADGGVLILLEKGVPRGFEVVAGARKFLLDKRISSPGQELIAEKVGDPEDVNVDGVKSKERGMIVAPCTNHTVCPMYKEPGMSVGRQDYCHFTQRYIRPPYLQKLVNGKDRNHEDVGFSYLSVMRGRDLRDRSEQGVMQGDAATNRAFQGYEHDVDGDDDAEPDRALFDPTAPVFSADEATIGGGGSGRKAPHGLSLPRALLPPLKRTGHVILDVCTPSGTLERWTVPRSFSRQAFHDARKAAWGDLWALGAKTRIVRTARAGSKVQGHGAGGAIDLRKVTATSKAKRAIAEQAVARKGGRTQRFELPVDVKGGTVGETALKADGRMRTGRIGGIRDKRQKGGARRARRDRAADDDE